MKLNSLAGERYMEREAERRQAERWEPEDDDTQDELETEKCWMCNGLGFIDGDSDEDCSECNGTGELLSNL
jgi:hypothetical protein